MLSEFKNPPDHYRVSPLWHWNTAPDPDEVEWQIREMRHKGIGGFTVVEGREARAASGDSIWEESLERARSVATQLGMSAGANDDLWRFLNPGNSGCPNDQDPPREDQLVGRLVELPSGDGTTTPALMLPGSRPEHHDWIDAFSDKLGISTAHCAGINRIVSAECSRDGWSVSMEEMKATLDHAAALGANAFWPCAWPYSLAHTNGGGPPASVFYQSTLWPHFRRLADYAARLSYALTQGKYKAQIALLNPINSFVYERTRDPRSPAARLAVDYFNIYREWLLKEHLDYDIICEESIPTALAIDQRLMIGDQEYALLIMPPMTAISCAAADKIAEYVDDGGALLANTLLPVYDTDGVRPEYIRHTFSGLFGLDPMFLHDRIVEGTRNPRPRLSHNYGNLALYESPDPEDLIPSLRHTVTMVLRPEVSIRGAGGECHSIIYQHRVIDDHDLFFFTNTSPAIREVKVTLRCNKAPYVLDPETGATVALPNCVQKGSRTVFTYRFESHESLLVYFTDEIVLPAIPRATNDGYEIMLSNEWGFRTEGPNCVGLSDWVSTHEQDRRAWTTSFSVDTPPNELLLVLQRPMPPGGSARPPIQATVNGMPAPNAGGWVFDVTFEAIDITCLVTQGENQISLFFDEPGEPRAMLAGSFSLKGESSSLQSPRTTINSGSWTDQGYPFYSGGAVYSQTVEIPAFHDNQTVLLRTENAHDVVEFIVNGTSAGVRAWTPYELDITRLIVPGPNHVELRVTNTSANALGLQPRPSGLLSGARFIIC